jgi:hypothetical protein
MPKFNFENVANDLEQRANRLSRENNPRNLGNDELVFAVAQFVRVLGNANKSANRFTWTVTALTVINTILVVIQLFK